MGLKNRKSKTAKQYSISEDSQISLFKEPAAYAQTVKAFPRAPSNSPTDFTDRAQVMHEVIRKLREHDLKQGHCFMFFDDKLPENQAYYEYPDGRIQIEQLNKFNIEIPRVVVRVLTKTESNAVRSKHAIIT